MQTYADDLGADARQLVTAAKTLAADGLLSAESSLGGGLCAHPTDRAATVVEARVARRTNPKQRSAACREALLDWC